MKFLHADFRLSGEDIVVVTLDRQANVLLLDESNYAAYRGSRRYQYYGGWATQSPARVSPPRSGKWHVVVNLGGYEGTLRANIQVERHAHV